MRLGGFPITRALPAHRDHRFEQLAAHRLGQQRPPVLDAELGQAVRNAERDADGLSAREKSTAFATSLSSSCAARSGEPSTNA